jgi:hypothetical protein
MTTGNVLYLLMCLAMFGAFAATLAYYSRGNPKAEPEKRSAPASLPDPKGVVTG